MSTILNTNGSELEIPAIKSPKNFRVAIVTAKWNPQVTHALRDGAREVFMKAGAQEENIFQYDVPGTVELVYAAARLVKYAPVDAVIVIGCVIRGDTPHFDYVCQQVAEGTAHLNVNQVADFYKDYDSAFQTDCDLYFADKLLRRMVGLYFPEYLVR